MTAMHSPSYGWPRCAMMIFTSGNRPSEIEECSALGIAEIVPKPVDYDLFLGAVHHILGMARPHMIVHP